MRGLACFLAAAGLASAQIAVVGETVYTMAGAPLKNGVVLIKGKVIERTHGVLKPNRFGRHGANAVQPGIAGTYGVRH